MTKIELEQKILAKRLPGLIALAAKLDNQILQAQLDGKDPAPLQEKAAKLRLELHRFCEDGSQFVDIEEWQARNPRATTTPPTNADATTPPTNADATPWLNDAPIAADATTPGISTSAPGSAPGSETTMEDTDRLLERDRATLERFAELARRDEQTILQLQAERDGLLSKLQDLAKANEQLLSERDASGLLDVPETILQLQAERDGLLSKLEDLAKAYNELLSERDASGLLDLPESLKILEIRQALPPIAGEVLERLKKGLEKPLPSITESVAREMAEAKRSAALMRPSINY